VPPAAAHEKKRECAGTPRAPAGGLRPPAPPAGFASLRGLRPSAPPANFVYPKERSALVDSGIAGLRMRTFQLWGINRFTYSGHCMAILQDSRVFCSPGRPQGSTPLHHPRPYYDGDSLHRRRLTRATARVHSTPLHHPRPYYDGDSREWDEQFLKSAESRP
jgi:hypothetical protein